MRMARKKRQSNQVGIVHADMMGIIITCIFHRLLRNAHNAVDAGKNVLSMQSGVTGGSALFTGFGVFTPIIIKTHFYAFNIFLVSDDLSNDISPLWISCPPLHSNLTVRVFNKTSSPSYSTMIG